MSDATTVRSTKLFRTKHVVFAFIATMMAYVLYHNERFLIDWAHPVWEHYRALGIFLLVHGVAGGSALILAPMQFFDGLRMRHAKLHRVMGRIYVTGALILAPFGAYTQWLDEHLGIFPRSFTVAGIIDAVLLVTTTAIGFAFALKRMIPQHRQWMTRSYAVALTFFEIRLIVGVMGWDQDPVMLETVVWVCIALAVLIGDIANQAYELRTMRPRPARAQSIQAVAAE
jgi:hypothetical protein